jgi:hypothetical protein
MSAPLPITTGYQPGRTVYAIIINPINGYYWRTDSKAWESYVLANLANYKTSLTDANGIGFYSAAFPTEIVGLVVQVLAYDADNPTSPIGITQIDSSNITPGGPAAFGPAVVDVVNKALNQLGQAPITSLDEDSEAASRAALIFDCLRQSLLRSHFWKFASYSASLAELADEKMLGWTYLYAYPPKCLMIRRLFDETYAATGSDVTLGGDALLDLEYFQDYWIFHHPEFRYKMGLSPDTFTKSIATNFNPAYIEYTYDITDPSIWDQNFYDAMVFSLAAELAHGITGKSELAKDYRDQAAAIVTEAKRLDGQEDQSNRPGTSSLVRARMG